MRPAALRRFSLAVFFTFGVLGLVSVLIESSIRVFPWTFVVIQTVAYGAMAGSIVLFGRRKWWVMILLIVAWTGVIAMNGGALSFVFSDPGGFRVRLGGPQQMTEERSAVTRPLTFAASELDIVYVQRGVIGSAIIVFLSLGYALFLGVIREEIRRRARFETEVQIAHDIQQSLLPDECIESPSCSICGKTLPAAEVGGDYHDIVQTRAGQVAVAIADVTGHGVGAGILSAMTKSALHLQLEHEAAPDSVLTHLNRVLHEVSNEKTFVTFAYALIDPPRKMLHMATAGHPPILHRSAMSGVVTSFRSKNPALGIRRNVDFDHGESMHYTPGDLLLLYTDGLLEATNGEGKQFGDELLREHFAKAAGTPQQFLATLLSDLRQFTARGEGFDDDVSLVCIRLK